MATTRAVRRLPKPVPPGKRLVVIGAGASRGATTSLGRTCLPPLNADFFTQLQRISAAKHQAVIKGVVKDAVELFGPNFTLTMEEYFTQLEAMARMSRFASLKSRRTDAEETAARRDRLMSALAAVLEESTDVSKKAADVCTRHAALVGWLEARDTVVSFNYDCVMDHALRRTADGKWSARVGYGFPTSARVIGHDNWSAPSPPTSVNDSVQLLKLHGSLNWQLSSDASEDIKLKQRLYQQRGTPRFSIIPPEWVKNIDGDPVFRTLWSRAGRAIRGAETIALVGFSFTPTDMHVEALFRLALSRQSRLRTLVIANPSKEHRRRIRDVFSRPLVNNSVLVRQYEDLEDFAGHLADLP